MGSRIISRRKYSFEYILTVFLLLVLCATGLVSYEKLSNIYYRSNLLPATLILELLILLICFGNLFVGTTIASFKLFTLLLCVIVLFLYKSYFRIGGLDHVFDFVIIYKSFIYLCLLFICPTRIFSLSNIRFILKIVIVCLFIKYFVAVYFFGISRPSLFYENNFELVMPIILFSVLRYYGVGLSILYTTMFVAAVFLSKSISAIVLLIVTFSFLFRSSTFLGRCFYIVAFSVLVGFAIYLISHRIDSLASIDRIIFLQVFLGEFREFTALEILIGKPAISPLSTTSCQSLMFYESLFSSTDSEVCYSVILHSFIIRTLYDHGMLGLFCVILGYTYLVNRVFRDLRISIFLVGLVFLNGLSVSSFNNVFFAFSVVLIIGSSESLKIQGAVNYEKDL